MFGSFAPGSFKNDGTVFYYAQGDYLISHGQTFALNSSTGVPLWSKPQPAKAYASPVVASNGNVYVGYYNGTIRAYDPDDGDIKWEKNLGGNILIGGIAEDLDGTIYVANTFGDKLYAINPDGSWKWPTPIILDSPTSLVVSNDLIYVKSWNFPLYGVRRDGTVAWNLDIGPAKMSQPAVASDGTIYIASKDGKLYAITGDMTPTCNLTANPTDISSGGTSALSWTTTNSPTTASINNGVGSVSPPSGGTTNVSPTNTTTYTLTVSNIAGTGSCQATVTVSTSRKVRVEVTWQELGQTKKVELKALLKDIK